jgi:hypothetical protein
MIINLIFKNIKLIIKKFSIKSSFLLVVLAVSMLSLVLISFSSTVQAATIYYISPTGSDSNSGTSSSAPFKTFAKAFGVLPAGGELILLDGTYTSSANGAIHWDTSLYGNSSAQIPSGASKTQMTYVHALNPGSVKIMSGLFIGRSSRKDSYIRIEGITFDAGSTTDAGSLYNTSFIVIRNCGFHSTVQDGGNVFGTGTNDGNWGNTDNLFEDIWVWGQNRIIVGNYRSDRNVWRRVVVRGDGCSTSACSGSGNPNVGITVYDSANVTLENIIVVDRILMGSGNSYGDFAVAQHTAGIPGGDNVWLGDISINSPDLGFYFEPDQQTLTPAETLKNVIVWNSADEGIAVSRSGQVIIENATLKPKGGLAIYFGDGLASGSYAKTILMLSGSLGSKVTATGVSTSDPAMKYPIQSALGATMMYRYVDRVLTTEKLWPWPNEARIKSDMCSNTSRGFCASTSLTKYIWEAAGNTIPADLYGSTPTVKTGDLNNDNLVNIFDYNILVGNFGKSGVGVAGGDINSSGSVDIFDYNLLIGNFGK